MKKENYLLNDLIVEHKNDKLFEDVSKKQLEELFLNLGYYQKIADNEENELNQILRIDGYFKEHPDAKTEREYRESILNNQLNTLQLVNLKQILVNIVNKTVLLLKQSKTFIKNEYKIELNKFIENFRSNSEFIVNIVQNYTIYLDLRYTPIPVEYINKLVLFIIQSILVNLYKDTEGYNEKYNEFITNNVILGIIVNEIKTLYKLNNQGYQDVKKIVEQFSSEREEKRKRNYQSLKDDSQKTREAYRAVGLGKEFNKMQAEWQDDWNPVITENELVFVGEQFDESMVNFNDAELMVETQVDRDMDMNAGDNWTSLENDEMYAPNIDD